MLAFRGALMLLCLLSTCTALQNYYQVLGVARGASEAIIKKAYRKLVLRFHPDKTDAPGAEDRFRQITEAHEVLLNKEKRKLYDHLGHAEYLNKENVASGGPQYNGGQGFNPFSSQTFTFFKSSSRDIPLDLDEMFNFKKRGGGGGMFFSMDGRPLGGMPKQVRWPEEDDRVMVPLFNIPLDDLLFVVTIAVWVLPPVISIATNGFSLKNVFLLVVLLWYWFL